jgi:glycosyltransferase involved in cell wall biosynthesis
MSKILFFDYNYPELQKDSDYPVGGATVQLHSWIKGFVNEGWEVGILVPKYSEESINKSVKFIETYDQKYGIPKLRWLYYRLPKLFLAIKWNKPDFIYQGVPGRISLILFIFSKLLKIKFILRISNDFLVDDRIKKKYPKILVLFLRYVYKYSDYVICQNKYQYEHLKKIRERGIHLITNPFTYNNIDYTKVEDNYIAWLGIFQYQKNLPLLFEIVERLPNYTFKIAGKIGSALELNSETQKALEKLNKCENVEFVGFLKRKAVLDFLSNAKLLLNTSYYEGFSNTFLEAFAVGTPVICPSNVDPGRIIKKFKLGEQFHEIDEAVVQIECVYSQSCRYRDNTCKYVSEFHDTKKLTKEFIRILMC